MTAFPNNDVFGSADSFRVIGGVSPAFVEALYPYRELTRWHAVHHLPGLTGRWMDTGATALGGAVKGGYHRIAHGHHLVDDGIKVLVNPELKFGEFLHHLGLDSLTRRGIPNPLIPKIVVSKLIEAGVPTSVAAEWASISLPKVLGGSVAVVCSGADAIMAFSDAIPHTWLAVGKHFAFGVLDTIFGVVTKNPVMLVAAAGEFGVSGMTAYRTMVDPIIPSLGVPKSVFMPLLGHAVVGSAILGAASGLLLGGSFDAAARNAIAASAGSACAITATFKLKAAGSAFSVGGPVAGITAFLLSAVT